jgi:hypothetical protein
VRGPATGDDLAERTRSGGHGAMSVRVAA